MSEPTEYPYRGMSEGFAGEWVDERSAADESSAEVRPTPPTPPASSYPAAQSTTPSPLADAGFGSVEDLDERGRAVSDRLSALLQSAVDEQVQEQRHLAELMSQIQAGLNQPAPVAPDDLRAVVQNAVDGAVTRLSGNFQSGMQALREQHDAQMSELSRRLLEAQNELREMRTASLSAEPYQDGSSVTDLLDGVAGMRTELRTLPEQVAPFVAHALAPSVSELGRMLSAVEEAQQASSLDAATMYAELTALLPRLEQVPEQIALLGTQVASLSATQAALAANPPVPAGPDAHEIADIVRKGVRDATRDFVRDYLRDAVRDIVTVSTRDTERRITDHVDEAVLALAQALLTRRPAIAPQAYVAPVPPPPPASAQVIESEPVAAAEPEPVSQPESEAAVASESRMESDSPDGPEAERNEEPKAPAQVDVEPPVEAEPEPIVEEPSAGGGNTVFEPAAGNDAPETVPHPIPDAEPASDVVSEPAAPQATDSPDEAPADGGSATENGSPGAHRRRGLFRRR